MPAAIAQWTLPSGVVSTTSSRCSRSSLAQPATRAAASSARSSVPKLTK